MEGIRCFTGKPFKRGVKSIKKIGVRSPILQSFQIIKMNKRSNSAGQIQSPVDFGAGKVLGSTHWERAPNEPIRSILPLLQSGF